MKRPNLVKHLIAAPLLCAATSAWSPSVNASAQSPSAAEHFSKDGISFDYPTGWSLSDKSSEQLQHLILTRAGSSVLIMVVAQREPLRDYAALRCAGCQDGEVHPDDALRQAREGVGRRHLQLRVEVSRLRRVERTSSRAARSL